MDEQRIQNYLIDIAEEEIQDVNLLNDIQAQLQKPDHKVIRHNFRLVRVAVAVFLLFIMSIAGYALLTQSEIIPDTIPQDLITELNEETTIEDMTLNLDWAYADAHQMAIQFSTVYDSTVTARGQLLNVDLTTVDGTVIPQAFGGGGGGGSLDDESTIVENSSMLQFDARPLALTSDVVDLILTINYGTPVAGGSGSGGSGGSGGGGGGGSNAPAQSEPAPERTYTFEFSVPLYPARDGELAQQRVNIEGNELTIQNVSTTPSMTIFDLCSPLLAEDWIARVYLQSDQPLPDYIQSTGMTTLDGEVVYYGGGMPSEIETIDGVTCQNINVSVPFTVDSGTLTIVVDNFYQYTQGTDAELIETDIAYFNVQGFDISYEIIEPPAMNLPENQVVLPRSPDELVIYTIESFPDTLTVGEARSYVGSNALQNRLQGDWVFEISVD